MGCQMFDTEEWIIDVLRTRKKNMFKERKWSKKISTRQKRRRIKKMSAKKREWKELIKNMHVYEEKRNNKKD